jgi:hypothetical protein
MSYLSEHDSGLPFGQINLLRSIFGLFFNPPREHVHIYRVWSKCIVMTKSLGRLRLIDVWTVHYEVVRNDKAESQDRCDSECKAYLYPVS